MKSVTPAEAKGLIDAEGYRYVDVRSVEEFAAGHAAGAANVPIAHATSYGMQPNPDFVGVMRSHFPEDAPLVLGCKSGGRSARACEVLAAAGYTNVVNMDGGFDGRMSPGGGLAQPGWRDSSLPVETGDGGDASYERLKSAPKA